MCILVLGNFTEQAMLT